MLDDQEIEEMRGFVNELEEYPLDSQAVEELQSLINRLIDVHERIRACMRLHEKEN